MITKLRKKSYNSHNIELNMSAEKQVGDKLSTESVKITGDTPSSFSDSESLEKSTDLEKYNNAYSADSSLNSFSNEYLYSSNDENLGIHKYEDESYSDSIQNSGDEYIDDEIPQSSTEYWGDLSNLRDFKLIGCEDKNLLWNEMYLKTYGQQLETDPLACKVFGIAIYYGKVAVKNKFQVFTGDAGFGNVSISIQGLGQHDVTFVSVSYIRNYIYEVTYQVLNAGYYFISVRWMDKAINGSPFLCKITY